MNIKSLIWISGLSAVLLWTSVGHTLAQDSKELQAMQKRMSELEAQVLNMQVVIGSLESLLKQQRASATVGQFSTQSSDGGSSSGDESERMGILETKIQALTSQVEQLTNQQQNGGGSTGVQGGRSGSTTDQYQQRGSLNQSGGGARLSSLPSVTSEGSGSGNPAMMYDEAYGHLLRRDYPSAEKAFVNFLKKHSKDNLAGNARYWLGEAYYQQGNFKKAADSFLKGYSQHKQGAKAPDSLLKLALSLNELGQTKAACSTFRELNNTFPEAPKHVSNRAAKESRRLGC